MPDPIGKIKHVVIIMQENRSFDSYFGTFPGADGIPMSNGAATVCVPDPATRQLRQRRTTTRPTSTAAARTAQPTPPADINGGKMDGFIAQAESGTRRAAPTSTNPACTNGVHARCDGLPRRPRDPQLLDLRREFVLQDHMFEPNASWSLPQHLFMVSEWSALCSAPGDPLSCTNALQSPGRPPNYGGRGQSPRPTTPGPT